jgi:hypothetical protein
MSISFLQALQLVAAGAIVLLLPGSVWLAWFPRARSDPFQRLGDACGLSLALTALAGLATFVLGIHLSAGWLAGIYVLLAGIGAAGYLRRKLTVRFTRWSAAALAGVALLIAWRLYQARGLAFTPWVDPLHHTLIVRKIIESGGIPATLAPYLQVPLFYHFGFHAITAAFAVVGNLAPDAAVLIMGQTLSALIAAAVYRLGMAVWGDFRRAGLAALLVGFFSQMPAYYLSWGRYTLAASLVLLPLAMAAAIDVARSPRRRESAARLAVLTGGTILTHYLAAILLALFLVILAAYLLMRDLRLRRADRGTWIALLSGPTLGLAMASPWVLRVWRYSRSQFSLGAVLPGEAGSPVTSDYVKYIGYLLGPQQNYVLLALAAFGLALALRWRLPSRAVALWGLAAALLTIPWGLRLGPFQPHHFAILLFLPAVLLAAHFLVSVAERIGSFTRPASEWVILGVVAIGVGVWGLKATADVVNPVTILGTQADRQALEWIAANTPADARFFINTAFWQSGVYRGVDGAAWLLPITGRWSLALPPIFAWGDPAEVAQINHWGELASQVEGCNQTFWDIVAQARLDYVYVREGTGSLQPQGLRSCPRLETVYQRDGVYIYRILSN